MRSHVPEGARANIRQVDDVDGVRDHAAGVEGGAERHDEIHGVFCRQEYGFQVGIGLAG